MRKFQILYFSIFLSVVLAGCDNFLDITPTGKVIAKTGEEYRALLTYEYKNFPENRGLMTLRSDEMTLSPSITKPEDYNSYFDIWRWNDETPSASTTTPDWRRYWHIIYIANYLIEHQTEITDASREVINQMVGEAYMLRAYCHFLLVNMFAEPYMYSQPETARGIPIQLAADVNKVPYCSSLKAVYDQILADIDQAAQFLNVQQWKEGETYRFNVISAQALKARVSLYKGDWNTALSAAQEVIKSHGELQDLTAADAILPNHYKSVESIVALEQVMTYGYKLIGNPSATLLNMYKSGDLRKTKYYRRVTASVSELIKGGSNEYSCSFRSAEAYLIAAEAATRLQQLDLAKTYLTTLMKKRYNERSYTQYAAEVAAMDQPTLLAEIYNERFRELAFEGFRWDDLRRTTQPAITKTYRGETFTLNEHDTRYTLKFPAAAVAANPELEVWPIN